MIQKKKFSDAVAADISVIEGLMGNPLGSSITQTWDVRETGIYSCVGGIPEGTPAPTYEYGTLIVFNTNSSSGYGAQLYLTRGGNQIAFRGFNAEEFDPWHVK